MDAAARFAGSRFMRLREIGAIRKGYSSSSTRAHDIGDGRGGLETAHDVALAVDEELREVPLDVRLAGVVGVVLRQQVFQNGRQLVAVVEALEPFCCCR